MAIGLSEYLAVMTGRAGEALRHEFLQALRSRGDPQLEALLAGHRRRSMAMFRPVTLVKNAGPPRSEGRGDA